MDVSDQHHAPTDLGPGKKPGSQTVQCWLGHGEGVLRPAGFETRIFQFAAWSLPRLRWQGSVALLSIYEWYRANKYHCYMWK